MISKDDINFKELKVSATKIIAGLFPGGGIFTELFFEYRGRLKQNRINNFITTLQEYLKEASQKEDINFEKISGEEFTDLFESVLRKVMLTNSFEKIDRFKKILLNQITHPINNDFAETYLDIVSKINEKEIEILKYHLLFENNLKESGTIDINNQGAINILQIEIRKQEELKEKGLENTYELAKKNLDDFDKHRNPETYGLSKGEYLFYIQDLSSKCLLLDDGVGAISTGPFELVSMTEFGKGFLAFIESV